MFDFQEFNYDFDGDGVLDSYAEELDTDGDGVTDAFLVDTDGDAAFDVMFADTDANGDFDHFYFEEDTDGNGIIDTVIQSDDYDQDGIIESETLYSDTDGDGVIDTMVIEYDTDLDGNMDTAEIYVDEDADGLVDYEDEFELVDAYEEDGSNGYVEPIDYVGGESVPIDLENFDPSSVDPADVSGDPGESMELWEFQGDTNRCAVYSQKFIIEEITGQDIDIEALADLAEDNAWFTEEGGTPILDMNKLLDYYGIENEMTFHNDEGDLRECLENGGKVIVSVDADEIWYGDDDSIFAPDEGVNHAVQVIGIDYSDPDAPMVILNDSGTPDGCGEMVPLDVFMDAWEDGNCQMISCM